MSEKPPIEIPGYELLKEIGSGGMATVHLAVQKSLDRKVAIKILRTSPNEADPERTEKRFLREGKTLAKISHKNVCGIYDIAQVGGVAYIAMEYLEGGTLVDLLRKGITAGEAVAITVQVAAALQEAHAQGIVHRDLKPANVMMRGGKVPVLTDFGIARELTADQTKITAENMIVGTPIYMSPEQVSGGEVDGRSDLYSLGIMFYELLTGQPPYQGDTPIAVCMQHLTAPIPKLSGELSELNPVLEKMLAKKREDRFDDLQQFTRSLRDAFVHSDSFREVLRFNPNTPWSDQLRELGFSFDTLRDAELRAAVRKQDPNAAGRTTAKSRPVKAKPETPAPRKPAPAAPAPARSSAPAARPKWLIPAGAVGLVAVIGLIAWMFLGKSELTEVQLTQLRALSGSFDGHLDKGELLAPEEQNAMTVLIAMQKTDSTGEHPLVIEREQAFSKSLEDRLQSMIKGRQFAEAGDMLTQAEDILDDDQYETWVTTLASARDTALKDDRIIALIGELEQIQERPGWLREPRLSAALQELAIEAGTEDRRYQAAVSKLGDTLTPLLDKAIADNNLERAQDLRENIVDLLPKSAYALQADAKVDKLAAQLAAEQTRSALAALLQQPRLGVNGVTQAVGWIDSLRRAELSNAQLGPLERQFREKVVAEADAANRSNNQQVARALLDPSLERFPDDRELKLVQAKVAQAEARIAQELAAEQERLRAGRLALDATPWAKVVSVTAADGQAVDLQGKTTTPFYLTVPEGDYTVVMQSPDGQTQQGQATVNRGKDSLARLQFATIDADSYLREAGYR